MFGMVNIFLASDKSKPSHHTITSESVSVNKHHISQKASTKITSRKNFKRTMGLNAIRFHHINQDADIGEV